MLCVLERSYVFYAGKAGLQRLINISTMARSCKTSWGLTCMTTALGIMTLHWAGG